MNDADRSRFATIELGPHGNDAEHWAKLEAHLNQIDESFGNRLFARTIHLLPVLLENFRMMKAAMGKSASGQRFADQYGMLLAGYATLLQDEPMNEVQAEILTRHVKLEEEKEEVSDQESALAHLLTTKVRYDYVETSKDDLVEGLISHVAREPTAETPEKKALLNLGIKVSSDRVFIAIPEHAELEARVYRGTRWSRAWAVPLSRLAGASRPTAQRIDGRVKKCISIPLFHFISQIPQ